MYSGIPTTLSILNHDRIVLDGFRVIQMRIRHVPIGYDILSYSFDEYLQVTERTTNECSDKFLTVFFFFISIFGCLLEKPNTL